MSVEVICADALEALRTMPDESFDALVTDPPFGIGFGYADGKEATKTPEAYAEWLLPIYEEALRKVKPGGFVAVWQAGPYLRHLWSWFGDDIHIYSGAKNFVQLRKTPINYAWDPIVMRYKSGADPLRPEKPQRSIDFFVANTASVISDKTRIEKAHPCPRPLDQTREIVRNFTLPGGCVLDPFAGSGTTGVACILEGREFVGIERVPEYVSLCEQRFSKAFTEAV